MTLFGIVFCGRLDSKYIPANQHEYSANQQAYSGSSQSHSVSQHSGGSGQYNGPINRAANDVPILRLDNNNDGETYNYALETGDGISIQEEGDARGEGTKAHGGFSYTSPDGQQVHIQYSADENGFLPQGSHIPVAPPVPEEILRAVEQNLADEARGVVDDGQYREDGAGQYRDDGAGFYSHDRAQEYKAAGAQQYNAGASGYYKAGGAGHFKAGGAGQYNAGAAQKINQNGYKYWTVGYFA